MDDEDVVNLSRWGILRLSDRRGLYLSGAEDGKYRRVSSAMVDLDPVALTVVTASGRRYRLIGASEPGYAASATAWFRRLAGVEAAVVSLDAAAVEIDAAHDNDDESGMKRR